MQIIYSTRTTAPIFLVLGNDFYTHKTAVHVKSKELNVGKHVRDTFVYIQIRLHLAL